MASPAWLSAVVATQLLIPIPNSRPLDPDTPRAVAAPVESEPAPPAPRVEAAPPAATGPQAEPSPAGPPPPQGPGCLDARKRCRTLTLAGVGVAAGGVGLLGAGIAGIIVGRPVIPDQPTQLRDFQSPGIALTAIGSAALITGVTLMILGRAAHKRSAR